MMVRNSYAVKDNLGALSEIYLDSCGVRQPLVFGNPALILVPRDKDVKPFVRETRMYSSSPRENTCFENAGNHGF